MLKARQLMDFAAAFRLLYLQEILSHRSDSILMARRKLPVIFHERIFHRRIFDGGIVQTIKLIKCDLERLADVRQEIYVGTSAPSFPVAYSVGRNAYHGGQRFLFHSQFFPVMTNAVADHGLCFRGHRLSGMHIDHTALIRRGSVKYALGHDGSLLICFPSHYSTIIHVCK